MIQEKFSKLMERQFDRCRTVLNWKASEYAEVGGDRLHNFYLASNLERVTPEVALLGMMTKHIISIYDMVPNGVNYYSKEMWDEKITDAMNYLILLRAIIEDGYVEEVVEECQ